ncbi:anti-sigma factor family protein [Streptomyces acidicola]|uniref:anti-sigma factor family protein n=1 Tax=Streptomyces acidicola TaxID=2596892 RepID=UPI00378D446C
MTCMQAGRVLQAYLDGETDDATVCRVAVHLADCRRCGPEARTYREIKNALVRRAEPDPDAVERLRGFARGLMQHETQHETQGEGEEQTPVA